MDIEPPYECLSALDIEQMDVDDQVFEPSNVQCPSSLELTSSSGVSVNPSSPSPSSISSIVSSSSLTFTIPTYTEHVGPTTILPSSFSPADFFLLLFDDAIFQMIVEERNRYAQ